MSKDIFLPSDILIPAEADFRKWSVIACDQFSSEREYWDRVYDRVGDAPSSLHMIIPEAYLGEIDQEKAARERNDVMRGYLDRGIFKTIENSYIYVEREITGGIIRRGLVGALDLEAYDYTPGTQSHVRASEKTVEARLPARISVRKEAPLELPHIMIFIDDKERKTVEPLTEAKESLSKLYDFELMENGGHIAGWRVCGEFAERVKKAMACEDGKVKIVIGDGNHSLAAAKKSWDMIKEGLSPDQRENHPARYALAELNNIYDEGIVFEPIHRVVFNVEPEKLILEAKKRFAGSGRSIKCVYGGKTDEIQVPCPDFGEMIGGLQSFLEEYTEQNGGYVDYIHDDASAEKLAAADGNIAFMLPCMEREELFKTVEKGAVFPKKSFSVGCARDKRYYLECRKIK